MILTLNISFHFFFFFFFFFNLFKSKAINYIIILINYAANIAPNRKSRNLPWVVNIQEKKTQFVEEIKGQVQIVKDYLTELSALVVSKKNKGTECIKEIFGSNEALIDNLMVKYFNYIIFY